MKGQVGKQKQSEKKIELVARPATASAAAVGALGVPPHVDRMDPTIAWITLTFASGQVGVQNSVVMVFLVSIT